MPGQIYTEAMGCPMQKKCNIDDRLSALPDDILVNILDRLNVPDAARTSILSRRWSQLSDELSRLVINAQDFTPEGVSRANISCDDLVKMNAATVKAIRNILAHRNPSEHTINLLSMTFYLIDNVPMSIGHAVANAMATHTIEKAEFRVLTVKENLALTLDDVVNYGTQFVSFFNECMSVFTDLTCLYMENLRFAESDFVSKILITCKQLEYLGFRNCDTKRWITLQVEHTRLSELSIVDCRFDIVELKWLPRLTRTNFSCWRTFEKLPVSFGHVPLLEAVSLTNSARCWHKMVKLSTLLCETSVRELRLGFKCEKIWVQPECTKRLASVFRQLSIVSLVGIPEGYDLTWTMFILEAAPSLEEFCMTVVDHRCEMQMDKEKRREGLYSEEKGVEWESPYTSNFKHHRLSKLIIFCFEAHMVIHVRRVMKAALNLRDVYLYSRVGCRRCQFMKPAKPTTFPQSKKGRSTMEDLMSQGIESHARIHFLKPCPSMNPDHAAMVD